MIEHRGEVLVAAPVDQVYALFSHFNDYPKFMSHVREVTYHDDQRSHWVVDIAGKHEWDAVNENWVPNRSIGWRSITGLKNEGEVLFESLGPDETRVIAILRYDPAGGGVLGDVTEALGIGGAVDRALQRDLDNFARMVQSVPGDHSDPNWSTYVFHKDSAAARNKTTERQNATMTSERGEIERDDVERADVPVDDDRPLVRDRWTPLR